MNVIKGRKKNELCVAYLGGEGRGRWFIHISLLFSLFFSLCLLCNLFILSFLFSYLLFPLCLAMNVQNCLCLQGTDFPLFLCIFSDVAGWLLLSLIFRFLVVITLLLIIVILVS